MRVRIIFSLKNRGEALPFHHQGLIYGFLKNLIPQSTDIGCVNYSSLKGQIRISRKGLHYCSKRVTLVLSSIDANCIRKVLNKIFERETLYLGNLKICPEYVEREQEPIYGEVMKFICLSPVIPKQVSGAVGKQFISPEEDVFSDMIYESTLLRMQQQMGLNETDFEKYQRFQLIPDKYYLQKIKERDKKFARIYTISSELGSSELRGYTFPFTLYAHPDVQRFAFLQGLGSCSFSGFGMLDLAHIDPTTRTQALPEYQMTRVGNNA